MDNENYKIIKSSFVEFISAFAIVFFTSYNTNDFSSKEKDHFLTILEHSMSLFFLIMTLFWICEKYSHAQFNPMISLGYLILDKISATQLLFNVFAQIIGVVCGDATLTLLDLKSTEINPIFLNFRNLDELRLIGFEALFTFIIAYVQFSTLLNQKAERAIGAVAVAGTYASINLAFTNFYYSQYNFLWLLVQSGMNFVFNSQMIYVTIGGILGPLIAILYFKYLLKEDVSIDKLLNDYEPNGLVEID